MLRKTKTSPAHARAIYTLVAMLALLLTLGSSRAWAQPSAVVVNPVHASWINSELFCPQNIGNSYIINGTLHNATSVDVRITVGPNGPAVVDTADPSFLNVIGNDNHKPTVAGLTWEYRWDISNMQGVTPQKLPQGRYDIRVKPKLGNVTGKMVDADNTEVTAFWVYVYNSDPGMYQTLCPSAQLDVFGLTTSSGLFVGPSQFSISYARIPVRVRAEASTGRIVKQITLSEPTSYTRNYDVELDHINSNGLCGVPGMFTLGGLMGTLPDGFHTIALQAMDNWKDVLPVIQETRLIVDLTAPTLSDPSVTQVTTATPPAFLISGQVSDPKPGVGHPASGVQSVDVTIEPPSGAAGTVVRHAQLQYGATPSDLVNWGVITQFSETGTYVITVTVKDAAGNVNTKTINYVKSSV